MTERNKVIEALEACVLKDPDDSRDCKHCPRCNYGAFITNSCINGVMADALALLKAQEPQGTPEAEWLLYKGMRDATCSYCKHTFNDVYDVENYDYYCRHCGAKMIRMRTVKWE